MKIKMKKVFLKVFAFCKKQSLLFYVFLCIGLVSLIAQCIFVYGPTFQESSRISKQEKLFCSFWEKEGAEQFRAVGLEPTETLYQEELQAYLEKYKAKNPTLIPENRIAEMKKEFRKWWETGGSQSYAVNAQVPSEKLYLSEERKFIRSYTDTKMVYRVRLDSQSPELSQILLHWILFPNWILFLLELLALLFCAEKISKRFGNLMAIGLFSGSIFIHALLLLLLCQTSFFAHAVEPYVGFGAGVAFLLGTLCFERGARQINKMPAIIGIGVFAVLIVLQWFLCPQIYVAAILIDFGLFALGIILSKIMPEPKKQKTVEPNAVSKKIVTGADLIKNRKAQTRTKLDEGFGFAMRGDFALAGKYISEGMQALMLETPPDVEFVLDMTKKIVSPSLYIEISSTQWLEWGMSAYQKNISEAALLLLEKALVSEKEIRMARKALYVIGEIRVQHNLNAEEGRKRLEKVIELNSEDILAKQAQKLLGMSQGNYTAK